LGETIDKAVSIKVDPGVVDQPHPDDCYRAQLCGVAAGAGATGAGAAVVTGTITRRVTATWRAT
jgi:hypothetical protein